MSENGILWKTVALSQDYVGSYKSLVHQPLQPLDLMKYLSIIKIGADGNSYYKRVTLC